jgi:hypothetical protein
MAQSGACAAANPAKTSKPASNFMESPNAICQRNHLIE